LLADKLPISFAKELVVKDTGELRTWECVGLHYLNNQRYPEALAVFHALYKHMLDGQKSEVRYKKGMPLVWIAECYNQRGYVNIAHRYLMLTLIEDAIELKGKISPETGGVYFRLVWADLLADIELHQYSQDAYAHYQASPENALYPEWVLQQFDGNWIRRIPSPQEAGVYVTNPQYISHLRSKVGDGSGKPLELLADYLLSCMPGCRTRRRVRNATDSDYDVVCSMEGLDADFRSELGRYFVCECKDWAKSADFTAMAKFCRVLDTTKSRFGILFSKNGIAGRGKTRDAEREQLKLFQDRGIVLIVVDGKELVQLEKGANLISLLRDKYEKVRLDLVDKEETPQRSKKGARRAAKAGR